MGCSGACVWFYLLGSDAERQSLLIIRDVVLIILEGPGRLHHVILYRSCHSNFVTPDTFRSQCSRSVAYWEANQPTPTNRQDQNQKALIVES